MINISLGLYVMTTVFPVTTIFRIAEILSICMVLAILLEATAAGFTATPCQVILIIQICHQIYFRFK